MTRSIRWIRTAALVGIVSFGGCDLLDVTSPGRIADEDLNSQDAFPGLVAGMAFDLTQAIDGTLQEFSLASGDLFHGGSYDFADIPRGFIPFDEVNGDWATMQQARWVAEDGIRRMEEVLENASSSALLARAYVTAGFANRLLGENLCETAIDGGGREPHTVHFTRALDQFSQAISIGQAAGLDDVVTAAYGGRASMKAWTGDWGGAVSDAQQVPGDFVYESDFTNEVSNDLVYETNNRFEHSVWGTEFEDHPDDPRAPWQIVRVADGSVANGANGATPMYQQLKYIGLDANVPLAKGTEMLLLRAEAELENGNIGPAFVLMNQARAQYGMEDMPDAATLAEAWTTLHFERGATNWVEGRRLWDRRRWFAKGGGSPAYDPFLEGRDTCWPISEDEIRANANLSP